MRALTPGLAEFGALEGVSNRELKRDDLRLALGTRVHELARMGLPLLASFFAFAWVLDVLLGGVGLWSTRSISTILAGAIPFGLSWGIRSCRLRACCANRAVALAACTVTAQAGVHFWSEPALLPTLQMGLILLASSAVMLSWTYFVLTSGASLAVWFVAAWMVFLPSDHDVAFVLGAGLLGTVLLAALVHHRRLLGYRAKLGVEFEQIRRDELAQQMRERYEAAIAGANDALWFWDLEEDRIYASARWAEIAGFACEARSFTPQEWFQTVDTYYVGELREAVRAHLAGETAQLEFKHRLRRTDGEHVWVLTRGVARGDESGKATSIAGSMTDISHVIDIEQRLVEDALQDKLTGLPNRARLTSLLAAAYERSARGQEDVALAFVDVDDFKLVNDNLGHLAGDQLLNVIAHRLESVLPSADTLARYGGDEFVVLLESKPWMADLEAAGRLIQSAFLEPIAVDGQMLNISASVGLARGGANAPTPDDLVRNADISMYEAKAAGKGRWRVFSAEMQDEVRRAWKLYNAVRNAVAREECSLSYQPIVSAQTGHPVGVEALFRWNPRDGQEVDTGEFIMAAERTGAIVEIGGWILRQACSDAASWGRDGQPQVPISVNVSAHQVNREDFAESVQKILHETGLAPYWLELELTETAVMQDSAAVCKNLRRLSDLGVGLAIDDFGTGYSSLSYLAEFPLQTLKIDGSFVAKIGYDAKAESLTKGIISMARTLGLKITAEMVETRDQLRFVTAQHCDRIQGFLASRPVTAGVMGELLVSRKPLLDVESSGAFARAATGVIALDREL